MALEISVSVCKLEEGSNVNRSIACWSKTVKVLTLQLSSDKMDDG